MLITCFDEIPDPRDPRGVRYELSKVLFFVVLAMLSNATSYRKIAIWVRNKFPYLKEKFNLQWKKAPSYSAIRIILNCVKEADLEEGFRKHAHYLASKQIVNGKLLATDGKVLRGSFDRFEDQKAIQVLSIFLAQENIILAHEQVEEKTNEIPVAQELIPALEVEGCIYSFDAMNCQKKHLK